MRIELYPTINWKRPDGTPEGLERQHLAGRTKFLVGMIFVQEEVYTFADVINFHLNQARMSLIFHDALQDLFWFSLLANCHV